MSSFFDGIPEAYQTPLQKAIDDVNETNELLRQVKKRFGTDIPDELQEKIGKEFEGITVTEEAIKELEILIDTHQERRRVCQEILDEIAKNT
ncbi:MAG: hypothetical protein OEW89_09550 [Gammaproteobacteria bacterium]|nr:hypothetical protein [Gammaproteobacteria bacterium]MDH5594314.1 hypothetical protein [Gammaproteobacteria bacterium]